MLELVLSYLKNLLMEMFGYSFEVKVKVTQLCPTLCEI